MVGKGSDRIAAAEQFRRAITHYTSPLRRHVTRDLKLRVDDFRRTKKTKEVFRKGIFRGDICNEHPCPGDRDYQVGNGASTIACLSNPACQKL
jgi:hypothetical protein